MPTQTFLLHGQPDPPPALVPLRAGPLTMLFDPTTGFVRRLQSKRCEVLRGIYAAVRDHNWDTIPGVLRETARVIGPDSFRVEFESVHQRDNVDFVWNGALSGEANGTVRYTFDGEARSTFRRNRIGFCVLHPIRECAGAAARQTRVDGRVVECRFPVEIEPQIFGRAGFRDLRGLAHEVGDGLWAELEFAGDTFEMEDQRNWTDASFKTYCTPLALPFPVEIPCGTVIRQTVTLRLLDADPRSPAVRGSVTAAGPEGITLNLPAGPSRPAPQIGLGAAGHGEPLTDHEVALLRRLRPAHLRVDLRLGSATWWHALEQAAGEARRLEARLELAVHLPRDGGVNTGATTRILEPHVAALARILALREGEAATSPDTLRQVRGLLGRATVPVGAGSDCNFCELNREHALDRLALAGADFLFWSVNPQVHAFDHLSVMETLEAQAATVETARAFAPHLPLVVSPVTLRQRFNPVATAAPRPVAPDELPASVDPRQLSLFAAAWTLGSLTALAGAGAASTTWFETSGWRGVLECERGSPLPGRFPSKPGLVFPLYHVFAALAGCTHVAPVPGVVPERVAALLMTDADGRRRLLLANLDAQPARVRLPEVPTSAPSLILDARTPAPSLFHPGTFQVHAGEPQPGHRSVPLNASRQEAMHELNLPPHALALIRLGPASSVTAARPLFEA